MVYSEYSMDIYKSLNISIGTVMKYSEMLKIVLDHFKIKNIRKHAIKIRHVSDQYKIQQLCDNAISKNGGTLTSVPGRHKKTNKCVLKQLIITLMH